MAEKLLKALTLYYTGDLPKIHELPQLVTMLQERDDSSEKMLGEDSILLNPYYIGTRYPADVAIDELTWEDAEKAFEAAIRIKDFVLRKIKGE